MIHSFYDFIDNVSSLSGFTVQQIRDIGSIEILGQMGLGFINSNVSVAQYRLSWESSDTGAGHFGDGDVELPAELYYSVLLPFVSDNMRMQYAKLHQTVERLEEGDSKVWFASPTNGIGEPDRKYKHIFSKYRKLKTL